MPDQTRRGFCQLKPTETNMKPGELRGVIVNFADVYVTPNAGDVRKRGTLMEGEQVIVLGSGTETPSVGWWLCLTKHGSGFVHVSTLDQTAWKKHESR